MDNVLLNDEKVQISKQILGKYVKDPMLNTSHRKKIEPVKTKISRIHSGAQDCRLHQ